MNEPPTALEALFFFFFFLTKEGLVTLLSVLAASQSLLLSVAYSFLNVHTYIKP